MSLMSRTARGVASSGCATPRRGDHATFAIRRAIREGEAGPGDRIPQARDLATVLGVNSNTVLHALRLLRDEGLVEMGRGRAIRVTGSADRGAVIAKTKELIEFARRHGYRRDELIALLYRLS
jgi:GntR family transcriptional regulator